MAARTLLDNNTRDESTILGTLAFAWSNGAWAIGPEDYGGMQLQSNADGVPLLRLPRITAAVITHDNSRIPKAARISVYSRAVKPQEVAQVYERLLNEYGIHTDQCSGGSVAWSIEDVTLVLTVRAMKELETWRVSYFNTYPAGRVYSFPPVSVVSDFYGTLLGSIDDRTYSGYAYLLAESGGHAPHNAVTGSVAWLLGERRNDATPPRVRRPRIAKVLNKHLLAPCGKEELPETYWVPDHTVWAAANVLGPRVMRNLYHLQEGFKE